MARHSRGLLFATGSGHIDAQEIIDFKECYSVGQELLSEATEENDKAGDFSIFGGCATNRVEGQAQCLYHSELIDDQVSYRFHYEHGAVLTLLPYTNDSAFLAHPYQRDDAVEQLDITWHPHDRYTKGSRFLHSHHQ